MPDAEWAIYGMGGWRVSEGSVGKGAAMVLGEICRGSIVLSV